MFCIVLLPFEILNFLSAVAHFLHRSVFELNKFSYFTFWCISPNNSVFQDTRTLMSSGCYCIQIAIDIKGYSDEDNNRSHSTDQEIYKTNNLLGDNNRKLTKKGCH